MSYTPTAQDEKSKVTGQEFYSGTSDDVKRMAKQIQLETGEVVEDIPVGNVDVPDINAHQERVDRMLDGRLGSMYQTPFYAYYVGAKREVTVFPGVLREIAILLAAVRVLMSQLYDVNPQQSDALQQYTDRAERMLNEILSDSHRIEGATRKARSRTEPPNMTPMKTPELMT